jgi:hypothetical protein
MVINSDWSNGDQAYSYSRAILTTGPDIMSAQDRCYQCWFSYDQHKQGSFFYNHFSPFLVVSHHKLDGSSYQIMPMIRYLQSIIFNETDYLA